MELYGFQVERANGRMQDLKEYRGKVLLIVNTASRCGLTPQLEGLEQLYRKYKDRGFVVLGFPCNQFGKQAPGTSGEEEQFCQLNYGVTFPMFAKIDVNGPNTHPLYRYLKQQAGIPLFRSIKWNFAKFLVDREGRVVKRFAPVKTAKDMEPHIVKLLGTSSQP